MPLEHIHNSTGVIHESFSEDRHKDRYLYLNLLIEAKNLANQGRAGRPIRTEFNFNRSLLEQPNKYSVAVSKARIPTVDTPILIAPFDDINLLRTKWIIGLEVNGQEAQTNIIFQPRVNLNDNLPYYIKYGVFSMGHFLDMINSSFEQIFNILKVTPGANLPLDAEPPVLFFDNNTKLFSFIVQRKYYDRDNIDVGLGDYIRVKYNAELETLIPFFDADGFEFFSQTPTTLYITDSLNNKTPPNNLALSGLTITDYFYVSQCTNTGLANWNPISKILIRTNLPLKNNIIPEEFDNEVKEDTVIDVLYNNVTAENFFNRNDIEITTSTPDYQNLTGSAPLSALSISVFWKDKFDNEYALTMPSGSQASFTLMFHHRIIEK